MIRTVRLTELPEVIIFTGQVMAVHWLQPFITCSVSRDQGWNGGSINFHTTEAAALATHDHCIVEVTAWRDRLQAEKGKGERIPW